MRKVLLLTASLVSLTALSACGLQGDLVRPVPLWGDPPNEGPNDPRTLKAEEDRKAADREAQQRADDEARRLALEQQVQPPAQPPAAPTP